jgi:hypothetical protein
MCSNKDFFEVQDANSVSCRFLDVKPGMRVVDTLQVQVGKHCIWQL